MTGRGFSCMVPLVALAWVDWAIAFRGCNTGDDGVYATATRYVVGEVTYEGATGQASGTETTYNHIDREFEGFTECHVTYELTGSYEASSGTLILDALRSNHSIECPADLIAATYPANQYYALQMQLQTDGEAEVRFADSGELLAKGRWGSGKMTYRTTEKCTIL